jgi:hypothetical protein
MWSLSHFSSGSSGVPLEQEEPPAEEEPTAMAAPQAEAVPQVWAA